MTGLAYLSGHKTLEAFKAKKFSPVKKVYAQIDRIAEVEPTVNVFVNTSGKSVLVAGCDVGG